MISFINVTFDYVSCLYLICLTCPFILCHLFCFTVLCRKYMTVSDKHMTDVCQSRADLRGSQDGDQVPYLTSDNSPTLRRYLTYTVWSPQLCLPLWFHSTITHKDVDQDEDESQLITRWEWQRLGKKAHRDFDCYLGVRHSRFAKFWYVCMYVCMDGWMDRRIDG